jgi:hypothetical protein
MERSEKLMLLNRIDWKTEIVSELKIEPEEVERLTSLLLDFCEQFKGSFIRSEQFSMLSAISRAWPVMS